MGSSSYITNLDGDIAQYIEYVPFGEVFLEERNNRWNTPFLFNGKELDEETGLYYYGARYYDSKTSLWLSVDPLAEKKPSFSPYNFCSNNPIVRTDPDGRSDTKYEDGKGNLLLNTNDGSNAVVTVTDEKRRGFDASVKGTRNTDDVAWNNTMKKYVLGFELSGAQETLLSMMNSDWSRRNAIRGWQNPTIGNSIAFAFSEAWSQWTNPELVVTGLSAGVAGLSATAPRPKLKGTRNPAVKQAVMRGQQMHKAYKARLHNPAKGLHKEYRLPSGRRIDFLDVQNGVIYELKPNNPRAIKQGYKQLDNYLQEIQSIPEFQGIKWKTVLDTY